jgi:hypothetical protein
MKDFFKIYRKKFSFKEKYHVGVNRNFACAVVIPARAEATFLPTALASLAENAPALLKETAVIVIVNRPRQKKTDDYCETPDANDNARTIYYLETQAPPILNIFIVEDKNGEKDILLEGGVGEARKIGMDCALEIIEKRRGSFIASLDADTRVDKNYLEAISSFFLDPNIKTGGAVIAYSHQQAETAEANNAAIIYELYMRHYLEGLRFAASPYAFNTIGSAMAFTPETYVKAGGMKERKGGEDFYFLQAVRKSSGISFINETTVHPSARLSSRTPFGTGAALKAIMNGKINICHNTLVFSLLKELFADAEKLLKNPKTDISAWLNSISPETAEFLIKNNFPTVWTKILKNTPNSDEKRRSAFHTWFDGFKTLKFVHFCENRASSAKFAKEDVITAWKKMMERTGDSANFTASYEKLIEYLRKKDKNL